MPKPADADQILELHQRLLSGDRTASEQLISAVLETLERDTERQFPRVDDQVRWDGMVKALLEYAANPFNCKATSGDEVTQYLRMVAWRRIANELRGAKRRRGREEVAAKESFLAATEADAVELASPLGTLLHGEARREREALINKCRSLLANDKDRRVLDLRLQGERKTDMFARALGVEHLSLKEQRVAVKRAKDRIDKILRRAMERK